MSGGPPIVFPANPTVGQTFTAQGTTWMWNGTAWVNANTTANFLPLTGGSISPGPLQVSGNLSATGTAQFGATTVTTLNATGASTLAGGQANRVFNIQGVTDGSNAPAGMVGEYLAASTATPLALTNSVSVSVASLSLSPGDWECGGTATFTTTGGTLQFLLGGLSTTANNASGVNTALNISWTTANAMIIPVPTIRMNVTATTVLYVTIFCAFTAGGCNGSGSVWARRAR